MLRGASHTPAFLERVASAPVGVQLASSERGGLDLPTVLELVARTIGSATEADHPLMDAGLDSLGAVELRNLLQQAAGAALPSTLIFDHPTARRLGQHLSPKVSCAVES